jgi:hypothetical protein
MSMQPRPGFVIYSLLAAAFVSACFSSSAFAQAFHVTPPSPGCQFLSAPAGTTPAFCDTFDKPAGTGTRSGQLDGNVWGVSRLLGGTNTGQGQYYDVSPTAIQLCGTTYSVIDPNDVQICDGQLVESQFDQTGVTSLAMYPKQPFDIAGRTGTIAFDVSDDSHGGHSVWPELWYVDTPVPTPFVHDSLYSVPANGFGVRFDATCPADSGGGCGVRFVCPDEPENVPVLTVSSADVVNNYVVNEGSADAAQSPGTLVVTDVGCVVGSSGPGNMNHFELRVSQHEIDVYGTDAGTTGPLKKLAVITNMSLGLTRGLVFIDDNHYNANKTSNGQGVHTFTWDNFAFDGPVLPRDLAFDVLDALIPVGSNYPGLLNTGWPVGGLNDSTPLTLTVPGVHNVAEASGALLTFNFVDFNYANLSTPVPFISYRVNNGSWQLAAFPFGACPVQNGGPACGEYTISVPVNLADVHSGDNTIQFTATDGAAIANVDLILRGAAGIPCTSSCPPGLPAPNITIAPSALSITTAQPLKVAVRVSGSGTAAPVPTGKVTLAGVGFSSSPINLRNGTAAISVPAGMLAPGPDLLTVSYSGDSNYAYVSSNSSVTVTNEHPVQGNATILMSPSAYPSITTAQPLALYIDIYGSGFMAPLVVTGTVVVTGGGYNSGVVSLSGGLATISIPAGTLTVGADSFTVSYSGDKNYAAEVYPTGLTITVTGTNPAPAATSTSLVSSRNPSILGDSVTLTATVTSAKGVPGGTVTFSDSNITLGTLSLSSTGTAALTVSSLAVGTHSLTASYGGATAFESSESAPLLQVVDEAPPIIRFDWEDGGLDGWQQTWGQSLDIANSAAEAYTGKHSLQMTVDSTETHSAIANTTRSDLGGFDHGTTVTFHVYSKNAASATIYPFAFDENWITAFGKGVKLEAGWNMVVYVIPAAFNSVNGIGIQVDNPTAQSGTLYLDTVTTN